MKGVLSVVIIVLILVVSIVLVKVIISKGDLVEGESQNFISKQREAVKNILLLSLAFTDGDNIPSQYTCDGDNINPALSWSGVPEEAKSLVLIMDDPDAIKPAGHVWDHWVVFNIDPAVTEVSENTEPEGTAGVTSSGILKYGGPCPPDGEHKYFFKLYALDTMLDLPEGSTKAVVAEAMEGHILSQGQLTGRYDRK